MTARHNRQEERILNLEHQLSIMSNTIQGSQTSLVRLQAEFRRLDDMVTRHETVIPGLRAEVESSLQKVDSDLAKEKRREWRNFKIG